MCGTWGWWRAGLKVLWTRTFDAEIPDLAKLVSKKLSRWLWDTESGDPWATSFLAGRCRECFCDLNPGAFFAAANDGSVAHLHLPAREWFWMNACFVLELVSLEAPKTKWSILQWLLLSLWPALLVCRALPHLLVFVLRYWRVTPGPHTCQVSALQPHAHCVWSFMNTHWDSEGKNATGFSFWV